jgi:hypothetical protein
MAKPRNRGHQIHVWLAPPLYAKFKEMVAKQRRSMSEVLRMLVEAATK